MRNRDLLLAVLATFSVGSCGITLSPTLGPMRLTKAPWAKPDPDLSENLVPAQQRCFTQIESLRKEALRALKAREARRISIAITSGLLEASGIALAASSTSASDGQAISGYIVGGLGAVGHIIDAIVPDTKAESIYAAWRRASDYYESAERRLGLIQICVAVTKPEDKAACRGLDAAIKIQGQGSVSAVEDQTPADEKIRARFLAIHGDDAIVALKDAYDKCAATQPSDFAEKK